MVMASSQDNFGILDQSIPLWKRELILRRRAIGRSTVSNGTTKLACSSQTAVKQADAAAEKPQHSSSAGVASNKDPLDQDETDFHPRGRGRFRDVSTVSTAPSAAVANNMRLVEVAETDPACVVNGVGGSRDSNGSVLTYPVKYRSKMVEERSSKKSSVASRTMTDNSAGHLTKNRAGKNNNFDYDNNEDCSSDSSEELQYGPGIVNRLRSKYLSLALRETQTRPSLSNIRRYSSLENILDNDMETGKPQITSQLATYAKADACVTSEQRFRAASRGSRKDSMKRARSVETLHRYDSRFGHISNEGSSFTASFPYMKSCSQDVNKNRPASMINPLVNDEVVIIENKMRMEVKKDEGKGRSKEKTSLGPTKTRMLQTLPAKKEFPPPDVVKQKLKLFESSQATTRPVNTFVSINKAQPSNSVNSVSVGNVSKTNFLAHMFPKPALSPKPTVVAEKPHLLIPTSAGSPRVLASDHSSTSPPTAMPRPSTLHVEPPSSPSSTNSSPVSRRKLDAPSPVRTVRSVAPSPPVPLQSKLTNGDAPVGHVHVVPAEDSESEDDGSNKVAKKVSKSALENIRKDGTSISFSFDSRGDGGDERKSHLPRVKTPLSKRRAEVPQGRQVGVIRPIFASTVSPQPHVHQADNLVNRVTCVEQVTKAIAPAARPRQELPVPVEAVSGSVVSSDVSSSAKVLGLWDKKKPWNQQQNTMVFNFSGTKNPVPDYIENDGVILRSRRHKPKAGEGGVLVLGASVDESCDWEDERLGPPSPCDVVFEGANVLINGRSSFARHPRHRKLRITFSEVLTSTFEYPSESSLLEEVPAATSASSAVPTPGVPSPLGGSSLASYTPSKLQLGDDFQLGITRAAPAPPIVSAPAPMPLLPDHDEETYLKPAQDADTVAWSAETTADLLF